MNDIRREDNKARPSAMGIGGLALFGGGSVMTTGGGLIAQMGGHPGSWVLLAIYGSGSLIAVVGSVTAIVKILAERSPEIRKASALAKIAKRRARQDGAALLLLERSLDKEGITTGDVLNALLTLASASEKRSGSRES